MRKYMSKIVSICLVLGILLSMAPARAASYRDVPSSHWAYNFINYLSEKDVLSGDGNGKFRPNDSVTRAEFIRMMVSAFGLTDSTDVKYTRVPEWAMKFVKIAAAQGFLLNYAVEADFNARLSRQEAVSLLMRYLDFSADPDFNEASIKDFADVSDVYKPYIRAAVSNGIVAGFEDGTFRPQSALTRAQALTILYQATGSIYNTSASSKETGGSDKNATINASVTLSNLALSGNVYVTEGAKFVTLSNVSIDGTLYVRAGTYLNITKSTIDKLIVIGDDATVSMSNSTKLLRLESYGARANVILNSSCAVTTVLFRDGAAGSKVTGDGTLVNFGTYTSDTICEIAPEEYFVDDGCTATIAGMVYGAGSGPFRNCGVSNTTAAAVPGGIEVRADAVTDGTLYFAAWMNNAQPLTAEQIIAKAQSVTITKNTAVRLPIACEYDAMHYVVGLVVVPAPTAEDPKPAALAPLYSTGVLNENFTALGTAVPEPVKVTEPAATVRIGDGVITVAIDQPMYVKSATGKLTTLDAATLIASLTAEDETGTKPVSAAAYTHEIEMSDGKTMLTVYFTDGIPAKTRYTLTLSTQLYSIYGKALPQTSFTTEYTEGPSFIKPQFLPETLHIAKGQILTILRPAAANAVRYVYSVNAGAQSLELRAQGDAQLSFDTLGANDMVRIEAVALTASGIEVGHRATATFIVNAAPIVTLGTTAYAGPDNRTVLTDAVPVSVSLPTGMNSADYTIRLYVDGTPVELSGMILPTYKTVEAELYYRDEKIGETTITIG